MIRRQIATLFPGYKLLGGGAFRIIRDSDIEIEEEAEDLVRFFRSAIKRRRRGRVIRLEARGRHARRARGPGPRGPRRRATRWSSNRPASSASPTSPCWSRRTGPTSNSRPSRRASPSGSANMTAIASPRSAPRTSSSTTPMRASTSSSPSCARRPRIPDVVAIKQTLYRAGKQSAVISALIDAAEAGKSVTAVVELKARFDEEQNLMWADALERAGVQVVYGFIEWKTHAKMSMVVRREERRLPHLLPLRHRQLSPGHRAHLHRSQLLHRRSPGRPRRRRTSSTTSPAISSRAGSSCSRCRRTTCATQLDAS